MIARLKGQVDDFGDDYVVIDVNGVGYQVFCASSSLERMTLDTNVILEIETHVREDHIYLFGFFNVLEREWFKLLTSVQGVGAKVGLAILGLYSPEELVRVIASMDKTAFVRVPGVGPKLASRLISELKDKLKVTTIVDKARNIQNGSLIISEEIFNVTTSEAASGLMNLGFSRSEAFHAVSKVSSHEQKKYSVEELIRMGLRELSSGQLTQKNS